jgi:hypothetical protein
MSKKKWIDFQQLFSICYLYESNATYFFWVDDYSAISQKDKTKFLMQLNYLQLVVFWVMTQYSDVLWYQRFGDPCWLHLQGQISRILNPIQVLNKIYTT